MLADRVTEDRVSRDSLQSSICLGVVLDNARESVMCHRRQGCEPDTILLSRSGFDALTRAKQDETDRGIAVRMLGKTVRVSERLFGEEVVSTLPGQETL